MTDEMDDDVPLLNEDDDDEELITPDDVRPIVEAIFVVIFDVKHGKITTNALVSLLNFIYHKRKHD